jgi:hypothetical protein
MVLDSLIDAWGITLGLTTIVILWDILSDSGLILLPLIFVFVKGAEKIVIEGYSEEVYREVTYRVFSVWLVFTLVIVPYIPFKVSDIRTFPRACSIPEQRVTEALNQSHIESAEGEFAQERVQDRFDLLIEGTRVRVSPIVYFTLAVSQSFKNEAVSRLPCSTNLRLIRTEMQSNQLPLPLRREVSDFTRRCYWPARTKALARGELPLEEYLWPGHQFFLETRGYYDNAEGNGYYSLTARPGFSNTVNRLAESAQLPDNYGFPTCKEWWLGIDDPNQYALRFRLFEATPNWVKSEQEGVWTMVESWFVSDEEANAYLDSTDAIVATAFFTNKAADEFGFLGARDYGLDAGDAGATDTVLRLLGSIGVIVGSVPQAAGASLIQLAAPLMKPLIIMILLVAFIPAMLFGSFKAKHVATFMMVISSIMFWPFLWELGRLVDDTLLDATGGALMGSLGINQAILSQWFAGFFFMYSPALFTMSLGWVGMAGADIVQSKAKGVSGAGSAGQSGASKATSKAGSVAKSIATKGRKND